MADEQTNVDQTQDPDPGAPELELDELDTGSGSLPVLAGAGGAGPGDLEPLLDVPVQVVVEIGRTTMTIRQALTIGPGSIVTLDRLVGEPADVFVNGRRIARGEIVAVDEEFAVRVTEILADERRRAA
jgi:flagellar motor switch protein FliN/FliY